MRALRPFRPYPPQFSGPELFVWDERSVFGAVISLVTDAGHLDILRTLPGVDSFEQLLRRAETRQVGGMEIYVASIDDLILIKRAAGRPKDLDHVRQLEILKQLRKDQNS